jgi:flagellar hook-length control protein FliK
MSIDLSLSSTTSEFVASIRMGKIGSAPQEGQEGAGGDGPPFEALLSAMSSEGPIQANATPSPRLQVGLTPPQGDDKANPPAKIDMTESDLTLSPNPGGPVNVPVQMPACAINWSEFCTPPLAQNAGVRTKGATTEARMAGTAPAADEGISAGYSGDCRPLGGTQPSMEQAIAAVTGDKVTPVETTKKRRDNDEDLATNKASDAPPPSIPDQTLIETTGFNLQPTIANSAQKKNPSQDCGEPRSVDSLSAEIVPTRNLLVRKFETNDQKPPVKLSIRPDVNREDAPKWEKATIVSTGERTPIAPIPVPTNVASAKEQSGPDNVSATDSTHAVTNMTIHSFETHFPIALSDMVAVAMPAASNSGPGDNEQRNVSIHIAPASAISETRQQVSAPTKILTIELEPASLGAVTVKMRITRSNVDLQISVESQDALRTLGDSGDKLVEAMKSAGCSVSSYTIQATATPATADAAQYSPTWGNQNFASSDPGVGANGNIGREGAEHDGRGNHQQHDPNSSGERRQDDNGSSRDVDRNYGLFL